MSSQARPVPDNAPARPAQSAPPEPAGLHLVHGRTMREALLDARRSLGARSIVVEHVARPGLDGAPASVTLAVSTTIPRSTEALAELRRRARVLLEGEGEKSARRPSLPLSSVTGRSPLADIERRLREHGASKGLRERVLEGIVAANAPDAHPLDLAAVEVGKAFGVAHLPFTKGELCVLALLGQTGAGKTTTLAKLASRLVRAGRRVAIATLDVERIGAVAELEEIGRSIGVSALALRDLDRFAAALARDTRYDVILIDGSGDIEKDTASIRGLRQRLDARQDGDLDALMGGSRARIEVLATLAANASRAALQVVTAGLEPLEPIGAVITKIDETSEPLPACEHAVQAGLGIAFLTNGPDVAEHFIRASAERFADIGLTGRSLAVPSLGRPTAVGGTR